MDEKLIARINELARKAKTEGLTEEETKERAKLREQYLAEFRQGMKKTLDNVYVMDEKGNKTKLGEKGGKKIN